MDARGLIVLSSWCVIIVRFDPYLIKHFPFFLEVVRVSALNLLRWIMHLFRSSFNLIKIFEYN